MPSVAVPWLRVSLPFLPLILESPVPTNVIKRNDSGRLKTGTASQSAVSVPGQTARKPEVKGALSDNDPVTGLVRLARQSHAPLLHAG